MFTQLFNDADRRNRNTSKQIISFSLCSGSGNREIMAMRGTNCLHSKNHICLSLGFWCGRDNAFYTLKDRNKSLFLFNQSVEFLIYRKTIFNYNYNNKKKWNSKIPGIFERLVSSLTNLTFSHSDLAGIETGFLRQTVIILLYALILSFWLCRFIISNH